MKNLALIALVGVVWLFASGLDSAYIEAQWEYAQDEIGIHTVTADTQYGSIYGNLVEVGECKITHYTTSKIECGKSDGITYSGRQAEPEVTVAVDKDVIPLDSTVLLVWPDGEIQYCRADDIGGGVNGNHIDLCVADRSDAISRGVKSATVYYVEDTE